MLTKVVLSELASTINNLQDCFRREMKKPLLDLEIPDMEKMDIFLRTFAFAVIKKKNIFWF